MSFFHKELAAGRWYELSISDQMGNIGSEVHRSIIWHRKGDVESFRRAFARALELFDLTLRDKRWRFHRKKEIARGREVFCDLFYGNRFHTDPDSLDRYFTWFALVSRVKRYKNKKSGLPEP